MRTHLHAFAIAGLALAGCGQATEIPVAKIEVSWPGDAWMVSSPANENLAPDPINAFIDDIEAGEYELVDHLLIIRHGRVVVDQSFDQDHASSTSDQSAGQPEIDQQYDYEDPNWHPFYHGTKLHSMQSVTKSVTSAALGIAIDDGLIEGVDQPVLGYFDAYEFDQTDPRKAEMTLKNLLTMRSGIDWVTEGGYSNPDHSTNGLEASDTWIQFVLDHPMDQTPGTVWEYNDGVSVLIGKVLREATGQNVGDWANEQLFVPIGINEFYWKTTPDGETDTEGGLYLKAHDLARIGHLFLNDGVWDGEQILSADYVKASITPIIADVAPDNDDFDVGYGYQWWINEFSDGETKVYSANGFGGQFLIVMPEHGIVAVLTGWNIEGNSGLVSNVLRDEVIPAALALE